MKSTRRGIAPLASILFVVGLFIGWIGWLYDNVGAPGSVTHRSRPRSPGPDADGGVANTHQGTFICRH
jgi:hypothetical protein